MSVPFIKGTKNRGLTKGIEVGKGKEGRDAQLRVHFEPKVVKLIATSGQREWEKLGVENISSKGESGQMSMANYHATSDIIEVCLRRKQDRSVVQKPGWLVSCLVLLKNVFDLGTGGVAEVYARDEAMSCGSRLCRASWTKLAQ